MCGIVGYTGKRKALPVLLEGLKKLEYRGYDSAGIALVQEEGLKVYKSRGEVAALEKMISDLPEEGTTGIGHTRWATHGRPSTANAHPHCSCCRNLAVVHNGIIENHRQLRAWLEGEGHRFSSETDTEVLAHLVEHFYQGSLTGAVHRAVQEVEGSYALAAVCFKEKDLIVCARKESPLVVGLGENENYITSDIPALLNHTRKVYILDDGEIAAVGPGRVEFYDRGKQAVSKKIFQVDWNAAVARRDGYPHFMLKEIMEQPRAVRETLRGRLDAATGEVTLPELALPAAGIVSMKKIYFVACGTAYHAGMAGKYLMERLLGIAVEAELASEFRYRSPVIDADDLVVLISQSGETADTLAALHLARSRGATVLAITNVVGSTISREADHVLFTRAGPEIAVASTKAYMAQLTALYLLALHFASIRGSLDAKEAARLGKQLSGLPAGITRLLEEENLKRLQAMAMVLSRHESVFFIGRNMDYPAAMEGALKLKEISYIHAEAYAAGELKHGALALITDGVPVIALVTQKSVIEKSLSNIQEVKARDGHTFVISMESAPGVDEHADQLILLPSMDNLFGPALAAVPLQLMAYYAAAARGCPVDRPRNLAKSVTVE